MTPSPNVTILWLMSHKALSDEPSISAPRHNDPYGVSFSLVIVAGKGECEENSCPYTHRPKYVCNTKTLNELWLVSEAMFICDLRWRTWPTWAKPDISSPICMRSFNKQAWISHSNHNRTGKIRFWSPVPRSRQRSVLIESDILPIWSSYSAPRVWRSIEYPGCFKLGYAIEDFVFIGYPVKLLTPVSYRPLLLSLNNLFHKLTPLILLTWQTLARSPLLCWESSISGVL